MSNILLNSSRLGNTASISIDELKPFIRQSCSQITISAINAASKLFEESTNKSLRTPVSLLQEIASKSQVAPPTYELIGNEGQMHQPIFVYNCFLSNEYNATAKGNSKKRAKHNAALAVLNMMREKNIENVPLANKLEKLIQSIKDLDMVEASIGAISETNLLDTQESLIDKNTNTNNSLSQDEIENIKESLNSCENPVGELIEIANRYSMRPPDYENGEEEGPPHDRQFVCFVLFGDYKETGIGRSKKLAKRNAALKLLFKLRTSGYFSKIANQTKQDVDVKSYSHKKAVSNIYNQLKASKNWAINYLLNNDIQLVQNELNKDFLKRLSEEENFEYEFFRVPSKANFIVSINFKFYPTLCYGGYGSTLDDAVLMAIYLSLNHIKIMCSRGNQNFITH